MHNQDGAQPCSFPISRDLSQEIAERVQAVPKACWKNSVLGLVFLTHQHGPAVYIEGWVADKEIGFSFEHGWLVHDEHIIEPTLILSKRNGDLDGLVYFPGIRYTLADVDRCMAAQREIRRNGDDDEGPEDTLLPFAFWNSPGGACTDPAYRRAWAAAFEEATGIAPAELLNLGSQMEKGS